MSKVTALSFEKLTPTARSCRTMAESLRKASSVESFWAVADTLMAIMPILHSVQAVTAMRRVMYLFICASYTIQL